MTEKRINLTMVVMSLIGGVIGFIIGELILINYGYKFSNIVLMGLYFGILAFCIGIMCLIGEWINPRLNGHGWRNNYLKTSFKFLIPSTLIFMFIIGMLFQFIYGMSIGSSKKIDDVVMLLDTSGSMKETDPDNERFRATLNLISNMDEKNKVAIYKFDDTVEQILPMTEVTPNIKDVVEDALEKYEKPNGKTNIKEALIKGYDEINKNSSVDRNAMMILLSDGGDNFNLSEEFDNVMEPIKKSGIAVYTIGMNKDTDFTMLKNISRETGGNYYNVNDVKDLKNVFYKIYNDRQQRILVDKRNGVFINESVYMILRILLISMIGCLIPLSVSLVFDNKNLLKGFIIGGIISGVLAGLILEYGFLNYPWLGRTYRFLADLIVATIFTLIPVKVDLKDYSKCSYSGNGKRRHIEDRESINNKFD
ncbi:vWA domain-containing protein [Clostridium lundense]|uniref:vWA domain-containing protein n=1 Tax=Clostridium lundense TaxID=319475 RepID=UPI000482E8E0|nr:VWA domain-containing protein [Clostridium lundense]